MAGFKGFSGSFQPKPPPMQGQPDVPGQDEEPGGWNPASPQVGPPMVPDLKAQGREQFTRSGGGMSRDIGQRELGFFPRYGFVSGPGGMAYSLQSMNRNGWGNPQWLSTSSQTGRSGGGGFPDPRYYTNPLYRPMFGFTQDEGGWMPADPFRRIRQG